MDLPIVFLEIRYDETLEALKVFEPGRVRTEFVLKIDVPARVNQILAEHFLVSAGFDGQPISMGGRFECVIRPRTL